MVATRATLSYMGRVRGPKGYQAFSRFGLGYPFWPFRYQIRYHGFCTVVVNCVFFFFGESYVFIIIDMGYQ